MKIEGTFYHDHQGDAQDLEPGCVQAPAASSAAPWWDAEPGEGRGGGGREFANTHKQGRPVLVSMVMPHILIYFCFLFFFFLLPSPFFLWLRSLEWMGGNKGGKGCSHLFPGCVPMTKGQWGEHRTGRIHLVDPRLSVEIRMVLTLESCNFWICWELWDSMRHADTTGNCVSIEIEEILIILGVSIITSLKGLTCGKNAYWFSEWALPPGSLTW